MKQKGKERASKRMAERVELKEKIRQPNSLSSKRYIRTVDEIDRETKRNEKRWWRKGGKTNERENVYWGYQQNRTRTKSLDENGQAKHKSLVGN